jgi:nicotinate-nucleotide adenylyltransferase
VRLAIFGGSFDPPHVGHLIAANDAHEQLGLDRLVFIPAATQPLKVGRAQATAAQRLTMVQLLVGDDPRYEVSAVEVDRSGLSFTVDTLTHFATLHPTAERYLLMGADVLGTFGQWKEPERILRLARPVLLERHNERGGGVPSALESAGLVRLASRRVDVSSTEIRERVRSGKSILGFVTEGVAAFIARDGLYR